MRYLSAPCLHAQRQVTLLHHFFCLSFPGHTQWFVFPPFLYLRDPNLLFLFDRECRHYKLLTPKTLLPSSLARTNLFCYNVWWRIWTVSWFKVMGERISNGVWCNNVTINFQLYKIVKNIFTKIHCLSFKTVIKLTTGWADDSWLRQYATRRKVLGRQY